MFNFTYNNYYNLIRVQEKIIINLPLLTISTANLLASMYIQKGRHFSVLVGLC